MKERRTWTAQEDALLLQLVASEGKRWQRISSTVGRPGSQCFQRYQILTTAAPSGRWTDEQKSELLQLVHETGTSKWTSIGKALQRTPYVCRSAYLRIMADAGNTSPSTRLGGNESSSSSPSSFLNSLPGGLKKSKFWSKDEVFLPLWPLNNDTRNSTY